MLLHIRARISFWGFALRLHFIKHIIDINLARVARDVGVDNRLFARAAFNLSMALISICFYVLEPHHQRSIFKPHFFYYQ